MFDPRRTLLLTMTVFALEAVPFGAWLALIPYIKETLSLDKAQLALALLGMPLAVIPALAIASRLVVRFGPRRLLIGGLIAQSLIIFAPLLAVGQGTLFVALGGLGVCFGLLQVALNVYAGRFEKQTGRMVMSRCHGFWALGVTAGSLVVVSLTAVTAPIAMICAVLPATVFGVWVAWCLPRLNADDVTTPPPRRRIKSLPVVLFLIAVYACASSMTEGAMADWAAIYLAERWPDGTDRAGIAVTIFAGFLAAGRFLGDAAKVRFGVVLLARLTMACAIGGMLLLILPLPLGFAFAGFALVGLGASVGYPLAVSAVAALDDTHEGANIAILSMITVVGMLMGPPLIGFLAETYSLRIGLAALLPGLLAGFALAGVLRQGKTDPEV